jgi:hypothetical protein
MPDPQNDQPPPPPKPLSAWAKAQTIGASKVGERYVPPTWGEWMTSANPLRGLAEWIVGPARPTSVAAQDPYGIQAWQQGSGPMPMLMGTTEEGPGIRAYHGSPHDFTQFDMSKIGTGEGAQAYGHGLYFAENPGIAEVYRNNLAGFPEVKNLKLGTLNVGEHNRFDYSPKGNSIYENVRSSLAEDLLLDQASLTGVPPDQLQQHVLSQLDTKIRDYATEWPEAVKEAQQLRADLARPKAVALTYGERPGKSYEVNLQADPEHFLDWDKPLSEQSPKVKQAANELFRPRLVTRDIGNGLIDISEKGGGSIGVYPQEKVAEVLANPADYYPYKGEQLYQQFVDAADAKRRGSMTYVQRQEAAAQALSKAGIPGIKYLDQVSRTPGKGTRNYVIHDDKLIDILRKYGWLPPLAGLSSLSQLGQPPQPEPR